MTGGLLRLSYGVPAGRNDGALASHCNVKRLL